MVMLGRLIALYAAGAITTWVGMIVMIAIMVFSEKEEKLDRILEQYCRLLGTTKEDAEFAANNIPTGYVVAMSLVKWPIMAYGLIGAILTVNKEGS